MDNLELQIVVSYRNSTSNHNGGSRYSDWLEVVSYRNSTSNHNLVPRRTFVLSLYLIEILHQTTTNFDLDAVASSLYLIEILHQTTTCTAALRILPRCILSKFYIKPQRW